jgi:creatinine amidohydrolase
MASLGILARNGPLRVAEMNWMQLEAQAKRDDRCILPLGCVEQHAYLSLATDAILAEKVANDAADPLRLPVFPVLAYGMTPSFAAYPGTISVRMSTYVALIEDMLEGFYRSGFRRIVLVNGHGGNNPVMTFCTEWMGKRPDASVKLHDWWAGPRFQTAVKAIDPAASHASWMENFPWTRLEGVAMPDAFKEPFDRPLYLASNPAGRREILGDGNFWGRYQRSDNEMLSLWQVGVEETRAVMAEGWP